MKNNFIKEESEKNKLPSAENHRKILYIMRFFVLFFF